MQDLFASNSVSATLIDFPHTFTLQDETKHGKKRFTLYPQTIGTMQLTALLLNKIGLNERILAYNATFECLRIVYQHRQESALIVAYNCTRGKAQAMDTQKVHKEADYIAKNTTLEELTQLLMLVVGGNNVKKLFQELGIEKEQAEMQKVAKAKNNKNCYSFGGLSIYGSIIANACEKYHMSFDAVVWDISFNNLQLLFADTPQTIFLSEEERKAANLPMPGQSAIKVTKDNLEQIKKMFK